mmetsp:Transcript_82193/g.238298  ORF Transcript_82193/g.238298 Transcript_82193/m.238298 type:complete len:235 (+) Transcript_82193:534-1238(+)
MRPGRARSLRSLLEDLLHLVGVDIRVSDVRAGSMSGAEQNNGRRGVSLHFLARLQRLPHAVREACLRPKPEPTPGVLQRGDLRPQHLASLHGRPGRGKVAERRQDLLVHLHAPGEQQPHPCDIVVRHGNGEPGVAVVVGHVQQRLRISAQVQQRLESGVVRMRADHRSDATTALHPLPLRRGVVEDAPAVLAGGGDVGAVSEEAPQQLGAQGGEAGGHGHRRHAAGHCARLLRP